MGTEGCGVVVVGHAPKPHDPRRTGISPEELRSKVDSVLSRVPSTIRDELEQLAEAHDVLAEALKD